MNEEDFKPGVTFLTTPDTLKVDDTPQNKEEVTTTITYAVKSLEEDINDYFVKVKASQLQTIRTNLEPYKNTKDDFSDFLLSVSSTLLGIVIGAFYADLKLDTNLGKFTFIVLPILVAVSGTSYFFLRKDKIKSIKTFAEELLKQIPNPEKIKEGKK